MGFHVSLGLEKTNPTLSCSPNVHPVPTSRGFGFETSCLRIGYSLQDALAKQLCLGFWVLGLGFFGAYETYCQDGYHTLTFPVEIEEGASINRMLNRDRDILYSLLLENPKQKVEGLGIRQNLCSGFLRNSKPQILHGRRGECTSNSYLNDHLT